MEQKKLVTMIGALILVIGVISFAVMYVNSDMVGVADGPGVDASSSDTPTVGAWLAVFVCMVGVFVIIAGTVNPEHHAAAHPMRSGKK